MIEEDVRDYGSASASGKRGRRASLRRWTRCSRTCGRYAEDSRPLPAPVLWGAVALGGRLTAILVCICNNHSGEQFANQELKVMVRQVDTGGKEFQESASCP